MCNIALSLRNRSIGLHGHNSLSDFLHLYGETYAADACTNNCKVVLPPRTRSTFMIAFSPNHEVMASCHGDHNVHVTHVQSRKVIKSLVGHERSPWCISFHPSSNDIIATGCLNGEVRVWDLRGGGSESWVNDSGEQVTITSLSFHPTDHVLLIASGNEIHLWDWNHPKPFVSIKTNSAYERVQLVRFELCGTRILTGIVNHDDEPTLANDDDIDDDDDGRSHDENTTMSSLSQVQHHPYQSTHGSWLNSWFTNTAPVLSVTTRSSSSRPVTASYNLRGRRETRSLAGEPSSSHSAHRREELYRRSQDYRIRTSDIVQGHTYSRDHQRILHARVNVQAEIQHQYQRLQQLRNERRRLEMRLRHLQNNQASFRQSRIASNVMQYSSSEAGSSMSQLLHVLEREEFNDYNEITELLAARVQAHLVHSLNDSDVEVSVDWGHPSASEESNNNLSQSSSADSVSQLVRRISDATSPSQSLPTFMPSNYAPIPLPSRHTNFSGRTTISESESPSGSYLPRRLRRSRRLTSRRRNYFNHIWPVPESHQGVGEKSSYRLQWWDFNKLEMPEISRCDTNVVVRQCKIHNDSSVDVSNDGRKVAALIWSENSSHLVQIGVFSLASNNLGQLLFRKSFGPSQYAVCLSMSPLGGYLAVGLKYYSYLNEGLQGHSGTMAEILKLGKLGDPESHVPVHRVLHPANRDVPHRYTSVNTIAWLPNVGQGLVYGTNSGELRVCYTSPRQLDVVVNDRLVKTSFC